MNKHRYGALVDVAEAAEKLRQRVAFSPLTDGAAITERTMALYREATDEFYDALTRLHQRT